MQGTTVVGKAHETWCIDLLYLEIDKRTDGPRSDAHTHVARVSQEVDGAWKHRREFDREGMGPNVVDEAIEGLP